MDVSITGRNVEIPSRFEDYVTEKSEKISHLAEKSIALEVKVIREGGESGSANGDRVEITLIGPGPIVRAEATGADKYAGFDLAYDKRIERVRQAKDRRKVHRGQHRPASLSEVSAAGFSTVGVTPASPEIIEKVATGSVPVVDESVEKEWSPVVIREKVFPAELMTSEEAVDRMELVGHDFFLFIDARTDRPSVVYRRKGWDYGVIGLEYEEALAASGRR